MKDSSSRINIVAIICGIILIAGFAFLKANEGSNQVSKVTSEPINSEEMQLNNDNIVLWDEIMDILVGDYTYGGLASVGQLRGDANFILSEERLTVYYRLPDFQQYKESGILKDLKIVKDGETLIEGFWDNLDSGDGIFQLSTGYEFGTILISIRGESGAN